MPVSCFYCQHARRPIGDKFRCELPSDQTCPRRQPDPPGEDTPRAYLDHHRALLKVALAAVDRLPYGSIQYAAALKELAWRAATFADVVAQLAEQTIAESRKSTVER